jgi:hypothetical protein
MATQDDARQALYSAIAKLAKDSEEWNGTQQSAMVRDAAIAYRAVAGGQQPGSVVVESK